MCSDYFICLCNRSTIVYCTQKKNYYSFLNLVLFTEYMLEHLHIEESKVPKMCLDLYLEHGTTMAGMKVYRFGINLSFLFS